MKCTTIFLCLSTLAMVSFAISGTPELGVGAGLLGIALAIADKGDE